MLASDKCHELAIALYSLAKKVSYDDVQAAVTYLSQCASNVLSVRTQSIGRSLILHCLSLSQGANGPLQERTSILDLDWTRANAFPTDYETDLDLDWSNLCN